tara:strand:- start:888 stop:2252 length:1365 start_codon:yes stop_codon:yes gene_type:complete
MPTRNGHRLRSAAAAALGALATTPAVAQPINEHLKLIASDGTAGDLFGQSVAISGTVAIVGAARDDDNGHGSGSAYLYDFSDPDNIIETKLTASDGVGGEGFGFSVAISGTIAIVGAPFDNDNGDESGSAYVYDFTDPDNIIETKLISPDGLAENDNFGFSVAISETTVIVGSPRGGHSLTAYAGLAHRFRITSTGISGGLRLAASDPSGNARFGHSVAISGSTALVGASGDGVTGGDPGSVYLFGGATQVAKLTASDGRAYDHFGWSVAIDGTTAIVGARAETRPGSAYLYDVSNPSDIIETKLAASGIYDFGQAVAISGTTALVGSHGFPATGSAYRYDFSDPDAIVRTELVATDRADFDFFGGALAISGHTAIVTAGLDDDNGDDSGSAYLFDFSPCAADLNGDGTLDFFDVSAFLTAFNDQDPAADFNADTLFDFFDVAAFIVAFGRGCP